MLRRPSKANLHAAVVPVYFLASKRFTPTRWSLFDGLEIFELTKDAKNYFSTWLNKLHGMGDRFGPSHGILVEPLAYRAGLGNRMASEGKELPPPIHVFEKLSEGQNALVQTDTLSLARMIVVSAWLLRGVRFAMSTSFSGQFDNNGIFKGGSHANKPVERTLWRPYSPAGSLPDTRLTRNEFVSVLGLLEPYYRPYTWTHDRLAVALASLWGAVTSNNPTHSLIGLVTALEAVVSTDVVEMTHQVAERTAILAGTSAQERVEIFDAVRDVYKLRSSIVHGSAKSPKGLITLESTISSPKHSMVSSSALTKLSYLNCRLILAALRDSEYMYIVRMTKDEDKQSKKLRDLFRRRLLS